jgi:hypothetical protein
VADDPHPRLSSFGSRAETRASTFGSRAETRASTFGSRAETRASAPPLGTANFPLLGKSFSHSWDALQRHPRLVVASVAVHGAFLLCWFGWPREQPPKVLAAQCVEAPHSRPAPPPPSPPLIEEPAAPAPQVVYFADGSTVELHGAASTLHSEELSEERIRLRLSGGARFEVAPDPERSFVISNPQVLVRAMGTAFSVDPDGLRTRVAVEHGRAQVIWRRGATILNAGEAAVFPPESEPVFGPLAALERRGDDAHAHRRAARAAKRKRSHAKRVKTRLR